MIKVGDKLWYVPYDKRDVGRACWLTVKSIGRKWITFEGASGLRAEVLTRRIDRPRFSADGRLYDTRKDWEFEVRRSEQWNVLRLYVIKNLRVPEELTIEQIEAAIKALGINT